MANLTSIGDRNLGDLPAHLFIKIRNNLDVNEQNTGWRSLAAKLDGRYTMANLAIIESVSSPATMLLSELSTRAMSIREFVNYAALAENYFILSLFNEAYIPVQITQSPLGEMDVLEGETISLTVKAKGYPLPYFQWYKDEIIIAGARSGTYHLRAQSQNDSGLYCCLVNNSNDLTLAKKTCPIMVTVRPAPELEIKEHPMSCTVSMGSNALFKCEIWGGNAVCYQWFLDDVPLQDKPNVIQGSKTNELRIYGIVDDTWLGCYTCQISREHGECQNIMTKGAVLQIDRPVLNYKATDKVALLIGNNDYRGDNMLSAPKYDVQTLSNIFQSLNFKVVSLLNLTKIEMIAAVQEFRKLVGKGVYCVFYFCGHGFEISNQCFLVPTDAPVGYSHDCCISADRIFNSLLQQDPQICCMILDICRKSRDEQAKSGLLAQDVVEKGNAIVCYGTSYGLAAYEDRQYGILVSHLKNVLALPVDIETVFQKLRIGISNDPKVNKESCENPCKQIPEIRTNLLEVQRSFRDPIDFTGYTAAFNDRQLLWEMAHRKPEPIILDFQFANFIVKVKLDFQQEFSNVLKIYTSVLHPGPTHCCTAYVSGIPADIAEKAKITKITHGIGNKLCKNYVVIHNIQRLKSAMKINVTVQCQGPDVEKTMTTELGFPLVAKLELWKERQDLYHYRRAQEVDDNQENFDIPIADGFRLLNFK